MTLSNITSLIRHLIDDNSESFQYIENYSSSNKFTLPESNVIAITDVYVNDISSGIVHSYSTTSNKVTISSSLIDGDVVQIDFTYYPNYSETELKNYIRAALVHLSINQYYTFTVDSDDEEIYPDPTDKEKNLIALISSFLIDKPINNYHLPDISLNFPRDLSLNDKISKAIATFKHDVHGIFGNII